MHTGVTAHRCHCTCHCIHTQVPLCCAYAHRCLVRVAGTLGCAGNPTGCCWTRTRRTCRAAGSLPSATPSSSSNRRWVRGVEQANPAVGVCWAAGKQLQPHVGGCGAAGSRRLQGILQWLAFSEAQLCRECFHCIRSFSSSFPFLGRVTSRRGRQVSQRFVLFK